VLTKSGDYSKAQTFAAAGQVQIAGGPAGASVIETVTVPNGDDTISPGFSGQFASWFVDGQHFLTNLSTTYWVYSASGTQTGIQSFPNVVQVTGQGNYVWTVTQIIQTVAMGGSYDRVDLYALTGGAPVSSYSVSSISTYVASGNLIGAFAGGQPEVTILDLSGSTPARTDANIAPLAKSTAFAAVPGSGWVVGNNWGALLDGASLSSVPRFFGYGKATDIAAGANTAAVATASGKILVFDLSTDKETGTIDFLASKLQMSSDGTVLAAAPLDEWSQYLPDRTINLYALPSLQVTDSIPYTYNTSGTPFLTDFSLSRSGMVLGQALWTETTDTTTLQFSDVPSNQALWSENWVKNRPIVLSPDGTLLADWTTWYADGSAVTNIYKNGRLLTAVPAAGVGWIDNDHLLASTYTWDASTRTVQFSGSTIYSSSGSVISTLPATALPSFLNAPPQFPTSNTVYDTLSNTVYSLMDGSVLWKGPPSERGAVASASRIVFQNGANLTVSSY
jgi:hypothetical protein